jgi:primase-polymerase (primpol)-like protein
MRGPKTAAELAAWLDRSIEHRDISQTQASLFLLHMVTSLIERGMKLEEIVESRFRLRDAASRKIAFYRESALRQSFQRFLIFALSFRQTNIRQVAPILELYRLRDTITT